ncbi:hypothetical protein V502_03935 [Pseudogymnoascus sp. VKM F-4520 (FW-2644)]|nr:hypothetical protein V502_03935 [Pseudogymnoascus sp. VKM F-4520 (FW-2644)]
MAIHPLPSSTTRILGSCQALTTPSSLVKELIDNAIDAKATSIDVIISANTVDKIEVHDNGHGIAHEDLDSLGRHGHTSKLRDFEELRAVGSSCLGFRGEALASSVSLGSVTITTRAEGEPVAYVVKLKATGGVSSKSSISHPIGTTVCVSNFLSALPVRRQTSISDASKTISNIKNLLQSYAMARLQVRFTLKVAKTGKGNWSYIPHPKGYIKEAAIQVAGKDVAKQCIEITSPCEDNASNFDAIDENGTTANPFIKIQAFLPSPDSNFSKLKGGHYASVDSRPVSCTRGTLKKVISSYKQHIRAFAAKASKEVPKDPFIYLRITCPIGSYDPNIEPAKDDVLFEDEDAVLSAAEKLFKPLYCTTTLTIPGDDTFNDSPAPKSGAGHNSSIQQCAGVSKGVGMTDFQTPEANRRTRHNQDQERITVDTIVDKAPDRESGKSHNTIGGDGLSQLRYEPPYSNGFVTARALPVGDPWSPPPTQIRSKEKLNRKFNTPFITPKSTKVVPGVRENAYGFNHLTPLGVTLSSPSQGLPRTSISALHDNVDAAMDFERRKEASTRRLREETAAVARREANTDDVAMQGMPAPENIVKTALQDGDPRAYLMRRQKSMTAYLNGSHPRPGLKRAKTMMLPLESIPNTLGTHNLVLQMSIETTLVSRAMHILSAVDDYTKSGARCEGLGMTDSGAREVEESLNKLMVVSLRHSASA